MLIETKEGAKKALDEMMSDIVKAGKTHAFNDEKHKDHVATVKKYHELTEVAFHERRKRIKKDLTEGSSGNQNKINRLRYL